jgi:hypothetical protein
MATTVAQKEEDLIGGLVGALLDDGFAGYCCGPKTDPYAVIAVYEWRDHVDVVTMYRQGYAAAARIHTPGGVRVPDGQPNPIALNPPGTVKWAFVGPMDSTIWAMLDLPHPERPDAPAGEIPTPSVLRVPAENQRPMTIRVPDPDKVGARERRLAESGPPEPLSEQYFNDLLDYVDQESAIAFASHFVSGEDGEEECEFTWGNFPTLTGRTAITEFTQGFFSKISSVEHHLDKDGYHLWASDMYATTSGKVTFTKLDGSAVTIPFMTGAYFTPDGTKMRKYTVCLDPSPLVGVTLPA